MRWINRKIFNNVKKIIPRISETELIALRSGTVSLDGDIFNGKVTLPKKTNEQLPDPKLAKKLDDGVVSLLDKYGSQQQIYPSSNIGDIVKSIGDNHLLSLIIDKKWNGNHTTTTHISSLLTKLSSVNPALGVTVMVPNSLGPAELLYNYGTKKQQDYYMPKLASGEMVPCFGLTGPNNGSDAIGSIDTGKVISKNGKLFVDITIDKRYITLAPIANIAGLAFNLEDPDNLLPSGKSGITVALIEKGTCGLKQETHHNPLNVGFPNGTLKGNLRIPLDQVIGGEDNVGEGWKMLMECLAAGRGVCLPATANACAKTATLGIWHYANNREQFKIPLIKMEAVSNKFCDMIYHTWTIQASINLTNNLLDSGERPAVLSAIMKQQTTDRAREVLNHAMDIHAGSAICLGENNFLEKFYRSAPIGITVEGSNTLTRNLIIFGQGLNKSHPHIYNIFNAIQSNNVDEFDRLFWKMTKGGVKDYLTFLKEFDANNNSLSKLLFTRQILDYQCKNFAILANFVALLGGQIKSNQTLSGLMADIMSNIYLGYSIIYSVENENQDQEIAKYCLYRLLAENSRKINEVINNYPTNSLGFQFILNQLKCYEIPTDYNKNRELIRYLRQNPEKLTDVMKKDIILDSTLQNLENLSNLKNDQTKKDEYNALYQKVISVGEYKN